MRTIGIANGSMIGRYPSYAFFLLLIVPVLGGCVAGPGLAPQESNSSAEGKARDAPTDPSDRGADRNTSSPPGEGTDTNRSRPPRDQTTYRAHVIVGISDQGINPYHEQFYRPNRTRHPCTYIRNFPCDIQSLNLSVGMDNYTRARRADADVWDSVEADTWYWIPKTPFVAVSCRTTWTAACLLQGDHGVGTTSSVLTENPNTSLVFRQAGGSPDYNAFHETGLPVDVFSVSWGRRVPTPAPAGTLDEVDEAWTPIYIKAAGNDPRSTVADSWSGDPGVIAVGGAYAHDESEAVLAGKQPDVVSYYGRPTARDESTSFWETRYGTSFAAPTVAGALSRVILELRRNSGYLGSIQDGLVDPRLGVSVGDLRDTLNRTASYDPTPRYHTTSFLPAEAGSVPVNSEAPWLQWGWGFYDGWVANATIDHLLGEDPAEPKPEAARTYMEAIYEARKTLYKDRDPTEDGA